MNTRVVFGIGLAAILIIIVIYWRSTIAGATRNAFIGKNSPSNDDLNNFLNRFEHLSSNTLNKLDSKISSHLQKKWISSVLPDKVTNERLIHVLPTESTLSVIDNAHVGRIAVICYIPAGDHQALQFLAMLYGSWVFVNENRERFYKERGDKTYHNIDLLAFCHPSVCPLLHNACKKFNALDNINEIEMNCWAIEQTFESPVPYGPINSFVMFNRTDIHEILSPYQKVLRSDFDVFITPALLTWQPEKKIVFGQGGYCDKFNMERLKSISTKLGMRHQGIHCIGSAWYGETELFIQLSKKTFEMTGYMWMNEFDPNATGLETIDFKANREGEWIRWWRPVSLLYGAELAINHLIDNLSQDYKKNYDTPSCSDDDYLTTPHIHCWHNDCEFQKFKFMDQLNIAIQSRDNLPGKIVHKIIQNSYLKKNLDKMTIAEYSTYIAWNSVGRHLRKWFS